MTLLLMHLEPCLLEAPSLLAILVSGPLGASDKSVKLLKSQESLVACRSKPYHQNLSSKLESQMSSGFVFFFQPLRTPLFLTLEFGLGLDLTS